MLKELAMLKNDSDFVASFRKIGSLLSLKISFYWILKPW